MDPAVSDWVLAPALTPLDHLRDMPTLHPLIMTIPRVGPDDLYSRLTEYSATGFIEALVLHDYDSIQSLLGGGKSRSQLSTLVASKVRSHTV